MRRLCLCFISALAFDVVPGTTSVVPLPPAAIEAILKAHNDERAVYGLAPYKWDESIAQFAAGKADLCTSGHSAWADRNYASAACPPTEDKCMHNENLAYKSAAKGDCMDDWRTWVGMWNKERVGYDCVANGQVPGEIGFGHWTQVVWDDSTHIGCALACGCADRTGDWDQIFACHYGQTGNIIGQRPFAYSRCIFHPTLDESKYPFLPCERRFKSLPGKDVLGQKVGSAVTSQDCADACFAHQDSGCRAFEMRDGCRLKYEKTGEIDDEEGVVGDMACYFPEFATLPPSPQARCDKPDVGVGGLNFAVGGSVAGSTTIECASACRERKAEGCRHFELRGRTCWLYWRSEGETKEPGYVSGDVACYWPDEYAGLPLPSHLQCERRGEGISNYTLQFFGGIDTAFRCALLCKEHAQCKFFHYEIDDLRCNLKAGDDLTEDVEGIVGDMRCYWPDKYGDVPELEQHVQRGVWIEGGDLTRVEADSALACAEMCLKFVRDGCRHFSHEQRDCYLKISDAGGYVDQPTFRSGFIGDFYPDAVTDDLPAPLPSRCSIADVKITSYAPYIVTARTAYDCAAKCAKHKDDRRCNHFHWTESSHRCRLCSSNAYAAEVGSVSGDMRCWRPDLYGPMPTSEPDLTDGNDAVVDSTPMKTTTTTTTTMTTTTTTTTTTPPLPMTTTPFNTSAVFHAKCVLQDKRIVNYAPIYFIGVRSAARCAELCLAKKDVKSCNFFHFDPSNKKCRLTVKGEMVDEPGHVAGDMRCYYPMIYK